MSELVPAPDQKPSDEDAPLVDKAKAETLYERTIARVDQMLDFPQAGMLLYGVRYDPRALWRWLTRERRFHTDLRVVARAPQRCGRGAIMCSARGAGVRSYAQVGSAGRGVERCNRSCGVNNAV